MLFYVRTEMGRSHACSREEANIVYDQWQVYGVPAKIYRVRDGVEVTRY